MVKRKKMAVVISETDPKGDWYSLERILAYKSRSHRFLRRFAI